MKRLRNKKESKSTISFIFLVLAGLVLVSIIAVGVYAAVMYNKLGSLGLNDSHELTGTPVVTEVALSSTITPKPEVTPTPTEEPTPTPEPLNDVINILVIGCDTKERGKYGNARSDVNLILTIDEKNDEIKLTTFMRDTLIYYEEIEDYQRLNFALQYFNHPDGVVKTLEDNFDIEIDHYMLTDYWGMADLIDVFNGVKIRLSDAEISAINDVLAYQNRVYEGHDKWDDFVPHDPGVLRLNGRQAVSYMRVRAIGTDVARIDRQFEVLSYIKNEIQDMSLDEVNKILNKLPDMITTDMSANEILRFTKLLYSMKECEMQTQRMPFDDTYEFARYKGKSIVEIDFEQNINMLHEYMYE